jgi:hypothetical protein
VSSNNPYSSPSSSVEIDDKEALYAIIDNLDVSEKWKTKFRAITLAGGPKLPDFKKLEKRDRRKAFGFSILGFLFGPIYYAVKGMWKRGLVLFLGMAVLVIIGAIILEYFGFGRLGRALGYGMAAVFALRANIDYYKKMVLNDNGWV